MVYLLCEGKKQLGDTLSMIKWAYRKEWDKKAGFCKIKSLQADKISM